MTKQTKSIAGKSIIVAVLVLCLAGSILALGESTSNEKREQIEPRRGESDASYQARLRLEERAQMLMRDGSEKKCVNEPPDDLFQAISTFEASLFAVEIMRSGGQGRSSSSGIAEYTHDTLAQEKAFSVNLSDITAKILEFAESNSLNFHRNGFRITHYGIVDTDSNSTQGLQYRISLPQGGRGSIIPANARFISISANLGCIQNMTFAYNINITLDRQTEQILLDAFTYCMRPVPQRPRKSRMGQVKVVWSNS